MQEIGDIKEIQSILLHALKRFDEICKLYGLRYYLSNGTLLGAVKYGGFIAWDDDADVLMPREDYDKLLSLSASFGDEIYELLSQVSNNGWRMPYAKFTDKRTVWREGNFDFGCEIGVSLDIFPIDKWHPHRFVARMQATYCDILKRMLIYTLDPTVYTEKRGLKKVILKLIRVMARKIGYDGVFKKIANFAKKSKKYPDRYRGCVVWTCHAGSEVFSTECFEDGGTLNFEGSEYPTPCGYEKYLSSLYGDYRKELPADKQRSNHRAKVWWKYG